MDNFIDSIGKNFERLLRWVYPGALFLVLLYASKPTFFKHLTNIDNAIGIWGLIVGGLVAGVIVYLLQANVVNYIVLFVLQLLKWDVEQGIHVPVREREVNPICCPRCVVRYFDRIAQATRKRWSSSVPKDLVNYLNYAWGTYHAVFMTGWLTIIFFGINESGSVFSSVKAWAVLPPAILLLVGGLFTNLYLSGIQLEDP